MADRAQTTTSTIGMPARNDKSRWMRAFTLIELILVMALLATFVALAAPSLSRSFKARGLDGEATQLLAVTEYARDEAVSQGVPMTVWIDPTSGHFGVQIKEGFDGDAAREKTWTLGSDTHFDPVDAEAGADSHTVAAEFAPEGTLAPESLAAIRIVARSSDAISLTQTADGWGYEIVKEGAQ